MRRKVIYIYTKLHGINSWKTVIFLFTAGLTCLIQVWSTVTYLRMFTYPHRIPKSTVPGEIHNRERQCVHFVEHFERHYTYVKCHIYTKLHGVNSWKRVIFLFTAGLTCLIQVWSTVTYLRMFIYPHRIPKSTVPEESHNREQQCVHFVEHFERHSRYVKYSRTPLIRALVIRIANYPDRLGPSGKFVESSRKRTCLNITGYRIKYSTVLWLLELHIRRFRKV